MHPYLLRSWNGFISYKEDQFPTQEESGPGILDHTAVTTTIQNSSKKRRNCRFNDNERYVIGNYTAIHGSITALKKFKSSLSNLEFGESNARSLKKLKLSEHSTVIAKKRVGRLVMLGTIYEKVRHFLMILKEKRGVMNIVVANTTSKALIEGSNEEHVKCIELEHSPWAKSLLQRIELIKRTCTALKHEIPEEAKNEAKLLFQHQIVIYFGQYSIPSTNTFKVCPGC